MTIYTDAIQKLIDQCLSESLRHGPGGSDDAYLDGLYDAKDAVEKVEEGLQARLPAIYKEYGVGFS